MERANLRILRKIVLLLFCILFSTNVKAGASDFAPFFEIDLENDEVLKMEDLYILLKKYEVYDKKYGDFYDLLGDFDAEFAATIASYGMQEKRLKGESEDLYIEFLSHIPKKYYQYLGPQLFEVPNMSEKVLNLPGIKETKNKFPTRIANAVKDIENIEHVSTHLYILLMPEAWGEYDEEIEYPQNVSYIPKLIYNKDLGPTLRKLLNPKKFQPGYKEETKLSKSDLRTLKPTKDSLLTSADIKAFISTIDEVDEWANNDENRILFSRATILWNLHDKEDPLGKYVPSGMLDLVFPCSRFVQKAKMLGKDKELGAIVGKQGFTINEWGYTCEKTIKAHKVANVRAQIVQFVREIQKGYYDYEIRSLSNFTQNVRFATMQGIVQDHKAPMSDVLEYRKNRKEFTEKLKKHKGSLFGHKIMRH